MSIEKDQAFFRNFTIVVVILALLMVFFLVSALIVGKTVNYADQGAREQQVAERTAPVGKVRMEGEPAPEESAPAAEGDQQVAASDEPKSGKAVYEGVCVSCHSGAIPGAPALGKAEDWAPRIDKGMDTLYKHAIEGFQGDGGMMPPKGGNASLSDDEVKAAVDYMVENSKS